ncbi:MAG TPA: hypothetical protein VMW53_09660 [archaeon]|nr:hypothetical protein [archaeon]
MTKFNNILLATLAIGLFALPAVVSTFLGSHEYIAPENVECQKCHPELYAELISSQSDHTHANADWTKKQALDCNECHTVSDLGGSPGGGHAARLVDCAICHNKVLFESTGESYLNWGHNVNDGTGIYYEYGMGCKDCHIVGANGYYGNLSAVYFEIVDPNAAHYNFYMNSLNDSTLLGGSESCVGCHTHVDLTFTQPIGISNLTYNPKTGKFGTK